MLRWPPYRIILILILKMPILVSICNSFYDLKWPPDDFGCKRNKCAFSPRRSPNVSLWKLLAYFIAPFCLSLFFIRMCLTYCILTWSIRVSKRIFSLEVIQLIMWFGICLYTLMLYTIYSLQWFINGFLLCIVGMQLHTTLKRKSSTFAEFLTISLDFTALWIYKRKLTSTCLWIL